MPCSKKKGRGLEKAQLLIARSYSVCFFESVTVLVTSPLEQIRTGCCGEDQSYAEQVRGSLSAV